MVTNSHKPNGSSPISNHRRVRTLGVGAAVLAALAVWAAAVPLLGVDLLVRPGGGTAQTVGASAVVTAILVASGLGWALLALLEHYTRRARAIWTGVALVAMLLSLLGPLTGGVTTAATTALMLMHLAVGAILIPVLRHSSPTR
ncbi:DUF6069 family protein [Streptomyces sp. NPDC002285]